LNAVKGRYTLSDLNVRVVTNLNLQLLEIRRCTSLTHEFIKAA